MRFGRSCAFVLVAVVAVMAASVAAWSQPKLPADFSFEKGKDSPGTVSFSHTKHKDAGLDKCNACHTKVFKMKKGSSGPLSMEKMKAGEQCGTCHNGKTEVAGKKAFAVDDKGNCEKCHRKS